MWTLEVEALAPNCVRPLAIYKVITNIWNVIWKSERSNDDELIIAGQRVSVWQFLDINKIDKNIFPILCLFVCPPICLSVCPVSLSVCLFFRFLCLSVCFSCFSVCPFVVLNTDVVIIPRWFHHYLKLSLYYLSITLPSPFIIPILSLYYPSIVSLVSIHYPHGPSIIP